MRFYLIGLIAGIAMLVIGSLAILLGKDDFAFLRGMMLIITGVIAFALGIRFRTIKI